MQFNEIYEKTIYAFEHDEVFELLTGQKGYAYQAPMTPVSIPTFDGYVYQEGIYPYFNSLDSLEKEHIISQLNNAYSKMMRSQETTFLWLALSSIFGQKLNEFKYNKSPFFIADKLLNDIKPYLIQNKDKLSLSKEYAGADYNNGLWGDVIRYERLLKKHFNYSLFG